MATNRARDVSGAGISRHGVTVRRMQRGPCGSSTGAFAAAVGVSQGVCCCGGGFAGVGVTNRAVSSKCLTKRAANRELFDQTSSAGLQRRAERAPERERRSGVRFTPEGTAASGSDSRAAVPRERRVAVIGRRCHPRAEVPHLLRCGGRSDRRTCSRGSGRCLRRCAAGHRGSRRRTRSCIARRRC